MKFKFCFIFALGAMLFSCGDSNTEQESSLISDNKNPKEGSTEELEEADVVNAISLWNSSIKDKIGKEGKWLSSVAFGETVTVLRDTIITDGKKETTYINIKLSDGKEGWAKQYLYAVDAQQGVVISTLQIYDRPDILAMSSKSYELGDVVAVYAEVQDNWKQVVGFQKVKKGWVSASDGLSTRPVDLKLAMLLKKIEKSKAEADQSIFIGMALDDVKHESSVFYDIIKDKYRPEVVEVLVDDLFDTSSDIDEIVDFIEEHEDDLE